MKKNLLFIIFTFVMVIASCIFIGVMNRNYGGALIDSSVAFYITIPCISIWELIRILKGRKQEKQTLKSKIIVGVVLLIGVVIIVGMLIVSKFYSLSVIVLGVLMLSLIPHIYREYKRGDEPEKNPILIWGNVVMTTYIYIMLTIVVYIYVVQPVSVADATANIAMEYGEESYEYVGHLTGNREENHLGVYWFKKTDSGFHDWIEVDVVGGTIEELQ